MQLARWILIDVKAIESTKKIQIRVKREMFLFAFGCEGNNDKEYTKKIMVEITGKRQSSNLRAPMIKLKFRLAFG